MDIRTNQMLRLINITFISFCYWVKTFTTKSYRVATCSINTTSNFLIFSAKYSIMTIQGFKDVGSILCVTYGLSILILMEPPCTIYRITMEPPYHKWGCSDAPVHGTFVTTFNVTNTLPDKNISQCYHLGEASGKQTHRRRICYCRLSVILAKSSVTVPILEELSTLNLKRKLRLKTVDWWRKLPLHSKAFHVFTNVQPEIIWQIMKIFQVFVEKVHSNGDISAFMLHKDQCSFCTCNIYAVT